MPRRFRAVFDTTFLILHYFSSEDHIIRKTREVIRRCKIQGNRGIVPTIVLAEFYVQAAKRVGRDEAKRRFAEVASTELEFPTLDQRASQEAGHLRHKYHEKIPWGDCIIAATSVVQDADFVLSEDPHFSAVKEIVVKKLNDVTL